MTANINNHSKSSTIDQLLECSSKEYGERPFFWDKWRSDSFTPYTCPELENDVHTIAEYLIITGYKNKNIMIFSENSYYWLATSLAISGYVGICVAANKDWQSYDIRNAIKTINTGMIVYSSRNAAIIDEIRRDFPDIVYISIDKIADITKNHKKEKENIEVLKKHIKQPDELCQIIFTTGSSGVPKAVPVSYENIASCEAMTLSRLPLGLNDTMYLFLPLNHIFGNVSAITAMRIGYSLYICSDTTKISNEIKECKPTIICGVPLFYERIFNSLSQKTKNQISFITKITGPLLKLKIDLRKIIFNKFHKAVGGKLRYLVCGAAPLRPEIKKLFLNVGIDFVEAYGMSETCAFITMEKRGHQIAGSVGVPYDDVECKLFEPDENGVGEIIIKGPNVFKGYFKNDKIEKSALDEDGFFHTGDLGRFDSQGRLFLTGRKKRLILTSNGENVSPDELEKLLSDNLNAKKVKVYASDDGITTTIYPNEDDGRADDEFKKIVNDINDSLPKFKRIKVININRNSGLTVK